MNTAAVSVNRGCNYVRLSLPDTACSLATCHRERAKAGTHLNIPPPPQRYLQKKIKKKSRESQVIGAMLLCRVAFSWTWRWHRDTAERPSHRCTSNFYRQRAGTMKAGRLHNCCVPLMKQNTCFGRSTHWTPTILILIEPFFSMCCYCSLKGAKRWHV